jgi:hypothetical protein
MGEDFELFAGKNFSDLMKDIYHNSKKKDRQINTLIQELQPLIKNLGDATVIVPLIKEYLDISVKNDDQLIKLAAIVQRLISSTNKTSESNDSFGISDEEKQSLLADAQNEINKLYDEQKNTIITKGTNE